GNQLTRRSQVRRGRARLSRRLRARAGQGGQGAGDHGRGPRCFRARRLRPHQHRRDRGRGRRLHPHHLQPLRGEAATVLGGPARQRDPGRRGVHRRRRAPADRRQPRGRPSGRPPRPRALPCGAAGRLPGTLRHGPADRGRGPALPTGDHRCLAAGRPAARAARDRPSPGTVGGRWPAARRRPVCCGRALRRPGHGRPHDLLRGPGPRRPGRRRGVPPRLRDATARAL
ncbi:MAG: Transcriptional regulator, AcrR family, partial [uncultured Rubrobacteraceae bacterium]